MTFLAHRDRQPELMDQPGLDVETHRRALAGLRTANSLSGTARMIWRGIQAAKLDRNDGRPLRILDVASGGGDVVIGVARLAARHGTSLVIDGCDLNPTAVEFAQLAARRAGTDNIQFFCLDAIVDPLPHDYDIVMSTLFLHHLGNSDARTLLAKMAAATQGCVLVDDLRRNRLGYTYAWAGLRLLTRSPIVHTDGPISVRSAFTIAEVSRLAREAGLRGARFQRHWPQRFLMSWRNV